MAGNKQKKSGFSLFSIFRSKRPVSHQRTWEDSSSWDDARRVWPSDEDKGQWVAEPGIDRKASIFIAKFHETRISESERQYAVYQS